MRNNYKYIMVLICCILQGCVTNKSVNKDDTTFIYLHDQNRFTCIKGNDTHWPETIYGTYYKKSNNIFFECDSSFAFFYTLSSSNTLDSFIVCSTVKMASLFLCETIDFYHDNNFIASYELANTMRYPKASINRMVIKNPMLNRKEMDIQLKINADTLFINGEHIYFEKYHQKSYKIYKDGFIKVEGQKVTIKDSVPPMLKRKGWIDR